MKMARRSITRAMRASMNLLNFEREPLPCFCSRLSFALTKYMMIITEAVKRKYRVSNFMPITVLTIIFRSKFEDKLCRGFSSVEKSSNSTSKSFITVIGKNIKTKFLILEICLRVLLKIYGDYADN